jgi:hypothetical protein
MGTQGTWRRARHAGSRGLARRCNRRTRQKTPQREAHWRSHPFWDLEELFETPTISRFRKIRDKWVLTSCYLDNKLPDAIREGAAIRP